MGDFLEENKYDPEVIALKESLKGLSALADRLSAYSVYEMLTVQGKYPILWLVEEAIKYFIKVEDYEKCKFIQYIIDTRYKKNLE